jgi:predicted DNA-binding helix-hairpin-helix protein
MYDGLSLKRVYYSAYIPVVQNNILLPTEVKTPLLREHRLYQADWLLRFYNFTAEEILTPEDPNLDMALDPKCQWALRNLDQFPIEVNKANLEALLRIPGVGNIGARKIIAARRFGALNFDNLKALGIVLKRARFFITCGGKYYGEGDIEASRLRNELIIMDKKPTLPSGQLNFLEMYPEVFTTPELSKVLGGQNYVRLGI